MRLIQIESCPVCGEAMESHRLYGAPWCPMEPRPMQPGWRRSVARAWSKLFSALEDKPNTKPTADDVATKDQ